MLHALELSIPFLVAKELAAFLWGGVPIALFLWAGWRLPIQRSKDWNLVNRTLRRIDTCFRESLRLGARGVFVTEFIDWAIHIAPWPPMIWCVLASPFWKDMKVLPTGSIVGLAGVCMAVTTIHYYRVGMKRYQWRRRAQ